MKRFRAILLGSAAAAMMVTAGGSAYAVGTPAQAPAPAVTSHDSSVFLDDTTGCRSHRMDSVAPADYKLG